MRIYALLILLIIISGNRLLGQDSSIQVYQHALRELEQLATNPYKGSFKRAVFITENAYNRNRLSETEFNNNILLLTTLATGFAQANRIPDYRYEDSVNLINNFALYKLLKDTITLQLSNGKSLLTRSYAYDFNDFFGRSDWNNMSVTKLLATHSGNCHSLPYLYKILADEIGTACWLSLAPNHIYIKNRCKRYGWYNTELTSGSFPIDAWIMGSGYIPLEAIQNGIYMDTLSNQQSIALCMLDLAKGYEQQTRDYDDGFIIKCCDLSLSYFPLNVQAMLLKAETLKRIYTGRKTKNMSDAKDIYAQMEGVYVQLVSLGYREMPAKMYRDWLKEVNKEKYSNQRLKTTLTGSK